MTKQSILMLCAFFCIAVSFQSCISTSALQTAKVVEKGTIAGGFGVLLPKAKFIAGDSTDFKSFALEASARYGITDKLDAGFKLTLLGTGGIDAKYQFIGDRSSKFAGSVGLGAGYLSYGDDAASTTIVDITVPTYFSYHPSESFAVYASPRFLYRTGGGTSAPFYGMIGGLKLGGKFALFAEYAYMLSGNKKEYSNQTQLNIGVGKNF